MGKDTDAKDSAALRWSTLGDTLHESLKVMVHEKRVSKREARAIFTQFDEASAHSRFQTMFLVSLVRPQRESVRVSIVLV